MADRTLEIQAALVARLKAVAGVTDLIGTRVYDRAPQDVTFPYIAIGDVFDAPFDAVDLRGQETVVRLDVWSRAPGRVECRRILAAANAALHWHDLAISAGTLVLCRISGRRDMLDPDGETSHGVLDLSIITDG